MKCFANWLFRITHRAELVDVASMARHGLPSGEASALAIAGWRSGLADALETLNLLEKP